MGIIGRRTNYRAESINQNIWLVLASTNTAALVNCFLCMSHRMGLNVTIKIPNSWNHNLKIYQFKVFYVYLMSHI